MMVIDEEGKLKDFPRNEAATQLVTLFAGDYISEDALVCQEDQVK